MTTKRFIPLLLQLVLAIAGQHLLTNAASAQETPVDAAAAPVEAMAPATDATATETEAAPAQDQAQSAATAAEESTQSHNPSGLDALWRQGDFVARGTLILMGIMSAVTWYIMFTKLWEQQRLFIQAKEARKMWDSSSLSDGIQKLSKNSSFRALAEDGAKAVKDHDGSRLTDKIDLQQWVTMTVQRGVESVNSALQGGLAFLATTGSTAPFIGLFGTVWGIYHALVAIGLAGQASIDKVAGPVGEALIMTAIGLAVAVPAVLGYNWLVRRNKVLMEEVRAFAEDLNAYLVVGARVMGQGQAGNVPPAQRSK